MQLGFTITENMIFRDGQLTNGSLADYKIPTLLDMPRANSSTNMSRRASTTGRSGPRGAGESTTISLSPAIGNAIADAIGTHLTQLPITPEAVFAALQVKQAASERL